MPEQPPAAAVDRGHTLEWAPPAALTAAMRWTCRVCGAAALRNGPIEYGSATWNECTGRDASAP